MFLCFQKKRLIAVLTCVAVGLVQPVFSQTQTVQPKATGDQTPAAAKAPLLSGITVHRRSVTTESDNAQRYFDQGLNLTYAFNHDEAIRSFKQALEFDPECAMAWWGIGLCHGPHINNSLMDEPRSREAWQAAVKAKEKMGSCSRVEQALINALQSRYLEDVQQNIEQRAELNKKYAESMREVYQEFPDDVDVKVLFAESLMDLRPWDLWSDEGEPRPETPEVLELLESAMSQTPKHPGANHLYIHAIEASPTPEKGAVAADRLRTLMPGSGHMVHMPAHIDVKIGKWKEAAQQNVNAMKIDAEYRQVSPEQKFYQIYMLHNPHFLSFVCMMEGRFEPAHTAAKQMLDSMPEAFLNQSPELADPFMSIEYQVLMRFGKWDQLLELPPPRDKLPITTAMWRFTRAAALAAKGEIEKAESEQELFLQAVDAVPEEAMGAISPAADLLQVGKHVLAGEIAYQKGDFETAVKQLQQGVEAETKLLYMEPPEWIQPVRHTLGAILVAAKRWEEAEKVYRADLKEWPENGWALHGLATCLEAQGDLDAAKLAKQRFDLAWDRADTKIEATCLCVTKSSPSK